MERRTSNDPLRLSEAELSHLITGARYRSGEHHHPDRLSVLGLWAVLFPVVLALAPIALNIPLLQVAGFWFLMGLFFVLVG